MGEANARERSRSPLHPKKETVILYVSAHGLVPTFQSPHRLPVYNSNVKVLSIVGSDFISGQMGPVLVSSDPKECGLINDMSTPTVIYRVCHDSVPETNKDEAYYEGKLDKISEEIKKLNERSDVNYDNGYRIEDNPTVHREFHFKPNRGENRRQHPGDYTGKPGNSRLCGVRPCDTVYCCYGLYIATTSNPAHKNMSIASFNEYDLKHGSSKLPEGFLSPDKLETINVVGSRSGKKWEDLIIEHKGLVRGDPRAIESDETIKIVRKGISTKVLTLEEIDRLFYGVGYETILVVDPTCRDKEPRPDSEIPPDSLPIFDSQGTASPVRYSPSPPRSPLPLPLLPRPQTLFDRLHGLSDRFGFGPLFSRQSRQGGLPPSGGRSLRKCSRKQRERRGRRGRGLTRKKYTRTRHIRRR